MSNNNNDIKSNAWPFQEALRILKKYEQNTSQKKDYVLFETGYGPSGLPHIGTFGEVARTTMVRNAFSKISDVPTKLIAFSDDLDGLRKLPENIPNKKLIQDYIGKPLTSIPDPYETHKSFGDHNNAKLCDFLDVFGFEYEFKSSTDCYFSGKFDKTLLDILKNYDEIINIILPTLGEERRKTYSPFLPICPDTGVVLQVPVIERNLDTGTIVYQREDGKQIETRVTGGSCKLQWKVDWAMRWKSLGVDYEMSGKDLIESVKLSNKICKVLKGEVPLSYTYELFLDEKGEKISKSRGNGITIDEWLTYASQESLSLFMYQSPKKAKRLYFDVIPKAVNEYITFLEKFNKETDLNKKYDNPVWHIHSGTPPSENIPISFGILLNLASVCNTEDVNIIAGFVEKYISKNQKSFPQELVKLIQFSTYYYRDFVKPHKKYRMPNDMEREALISLREELSGNPLYVSPEDIQTKVYEVGKNSGFENLREWFQAQYEVLFGQSEGPRIGSFIHLYGAEKYSDLIYKALEGKFINKT
ncbi:MAG: lysine--tRNA ligase [Rhodospirillaceae bacterium]|nr:lysine--tRNA ligase [Rhodospirillaceae bacterium]